MTFAAYPDDRVIGGIADFEDSVKRDDGFIRPSNFLNGEVRFAKLLNARRTDNLHIPRCTSVPVRYHVVLRLLLGVPTKPVENILEGMNHGFFI